MSTELVVDVKKQVQAALEEVKKKTIENVFFVACGGSSALMYPSKYVIDREAKKIDAHLYSSNEFIHRNHNKLGENSLVILCSHSGNTPETVESAKFARSKGALAVSLTNVEGSPLAQASDVVLKYEWGEEANAFTTNYSVLYQLVFGVLKTIENNDKFALIEESLENLQQVHEKAAELYKGNAEDFGQMYKNENIIYTMASGANYGVAYSFAICILMEMQWIHSHAIHAGEYFHGPFEIIDQETSFIILLGLDETRHLEERALEFSKRYGKKLIVLDAADFDFTGVREEVKGYIAPLVLNYVLRTYADRLAEERNHPLSTRRYMWKVEY
ncbi:fructoselysine 6-phosphate deglycase [Fictibacillus enclensis]|uniref:Fructosamine deglycase n=1 Tax=Fictibacillus enclensis TaxID=1017270 RepID=A0A0V8IZU6_9BACL|nr:SIS domain-containing protein [Fictibacillus enclensis]KSU80342.1 fructosamine deglycase [Fictibacillus enclensis]SCC38276.1 fructoselysine 6-phosphate deglycase [Fictibacillus enclensis]